MSAAERPVDLAMLVDGALREQQDLSAVDRFAQRHDAEVHTLYERRYEELIPVDVTPGAGEQLAFRVDLDRCTGCKACVSACHSLNGLEEEETWRDVGLVIGVEADVPVQQTVTTACHHCADPGCLSGCPVQAYEKDPATGIVRHLDDQCIGCQYCLLKCPYDVPKYDASRGIVRKCDMCAGRLAEGEAPACVQGCPTSAISIEIVATETARSRDALIPQLAGELPSSDITHPTTRYVTRRPIDSLGTASTRPLLPSAPHDPLAIMLVLTQLSIGVLVLDTLFALSAAFGSGGASAPEAGRIARLGLAAGAAALGLGAATLHLGRPLYAFRAFLGWRTSWMSREILAFGAYVPAALATAGAGAAATWLDGPMAARATALLPWLQAATAAVGLGSLACSAMIYVDTRRASWAAERTFPRFAATTFVLGALACATTALATTGLGLAAAAALAWVLLSESQLADSAPQTPKTDLERTSVLLATSLRPRLTLQIVLGSVAVGLAIGGSLFGLLGAALTPWLVGGGLALAFGSELVGRHLFFTSEAARAMPGS